MNIYQPTDNPWAPRLQVLTDEQIKQLHTASLEILERVGVQVVAPEALEASSWSRRFRGPQECGSHPSSSYREGDRDCPIPDCALHARR